jgi:hypothetical protein
MALTALAKLLTFLHSEETKPAHSLSKPCDAIAAAASVRVAPLPTLATTAKVSLSIEPTKSSARIWDFDRMAFTPVATKENVVMIFNTYKKALV